MNISEHGPLQRHRAMRDEIAAITHLRCGQTADHLEVVEAFPRQARSAVSGALSRAHPAESPSWHANSTPWSPTCARVFDLEVDFATPGRQFGLVNAVMPSATPFSSRLTRARRTTAGRFLERRGATAGTW